MREDTKEGFRLTGWLVFGFIVVVVLIVGTFVVRAAFAPQIGQGQKRINTNTGRYIEATYDQFYDECNAVAMNEAQQQTFIKQLAAAKKSGDKEAEQKAQTNLDAITNTHAALAAEYNSDSSKTGTRAQHKASDLPWQINLTYNPQEPTTCR